MPNVIKLLLGGKLSTQDARLALLFLLLPIKVARDHAHRSHGKSPAVSDSPEHSNIIVVSKAIL